MFTKVNKVAQLQKRSKDALSVFQATIANLSIVNDDIAVEQSRIVSEMKVLEKQGDDLQDALTENAGFIKKINEFLGVE